MKINKGQFFLSQKKQIAFSYKRAKGHIWSYIKNRFIWHFYPRMGKVAKFPDHVDLELASICQMKCPMCYTINEKYKKEVPLRLMDPELFKKCIDECAKYGVYSIRLSLRGEPFLNKHVVELTRYAKQKGIKEVSTLTNGLALTPELFVELMDAGIDWITISFDGMGETYNAIRYPAKFDEAVEKIRTYHKIKQERGAVKPVIKIQAVWPAIKDDPQAFYDLFNPIVDNIASNPLIDFNHENEDPQFEENFRCPVLYQRLVVGSNGEVLLCSNDEYGRYLIGDAKVESLYDIWHGKRMTEARRIHEQHRGHKELEPCKECYLPRKTQAQTAKVGGVNVMVENYVNNPEEITKLVSSLEAAEKAEAKSGTP